MSAASSPAPAEDMHSEQCAGGALQESGATMLVPFSYNNPFWDGLQAEERSYDVAGVELSVRQDWKPDGRGGSRLGFGASVYDAAFVLSHFLAVLNPGVLPGRTVLDIGTGLGLSSLACALSGAAAVVATDGDAHLLRDSTLPNLQRNMSTVPELRRWGAVAAPSLPGPADAGADGAPAAAAAEEATVHSETSSLGHETVSQHGPGQPLSAARQLPAAAAASDSSVASGGDPPPDRLLHVAPLLWGDRSHEDVVLQCLQGRAPDVIVAADIVAAPYEEALPLLAESLLRLMGPHTTAYIAHKPRHVCEERWFRRLGKRLRVSVLPRGDSIHPDFRDSSPIRIVKLQHKAAQDEGKAQATS